MLDKPNHEAVEPTAGGAPGDREAPPAPYRNPELEVVERLEFMARSFRGPLPDPETLAQYDAVLPGTAARIVDSFDEQRRHRIGMERMEAADTRLQRWLGSICGAIIGIAAMFGGIWLVATGHDTAGATIACGGVGALAGVFVVGSWQRNTEAKALAEVRKAFQAPDEEQ